MIAERPSAARYATAPEALRLAMFSTRLERLRQFNRLAVLVAATLLAVGIALIAVWAVRAYNMLGAKDCAQTVKDPNKSETPESAPTAPAVRRR